MSAVGRHAQPEIKARLLEVCTSHALACGLPEQLAPFARATGCSSRMLLYHFGTRDALLRAVLERARHRQLELFGALLRPRPDLPYTATLAHAWTVITSGDGEPYLRMFRQWGGDARVRQLWPDLHQAATTDWLGPLEEGLRSVGRPELATLVLAALRGLLMDLDATGDVVRTDQAFQLLLSTLALEEGAADTCRVL